MPSTSTLSTKTLLVEGVTAQQFVAWERELLVAVDAEKPPKEYYRVLKSSEHLLGVADITGKLVGIPAPLQTDRDLVTRAGVGPVYDATDGNRIITPAIPAVYDVRGWCAEMQRWNLMEAAVKQIVLDRIDKAKGEDLGAIFDAGGTVFDGYEALKRAIHFNKDVDVQLLLQEINTFAQYGTKTDRVCASRMTRLVIRLQTVGHPDVTKPQLVADFKATVAK
ncbi:hypothetical protein HK101_007236, partial [Irineochytrium annulatum]